MLPLIYVAVDDVGKDHGAGAISKPQHFSAPKNTKLTVPSKMEILGESCTMYKPDKLSARIARVTFPSPHLLTLVTKLENFVSVLIVCQLWGLQYHVV